MSVTTRLLIVVVAAVTNIGLLIWARGYAHRHGDEVGSLSVAGMTASL